MEITKILYAKNRQTWRRWLAKHHHSESEIWLIYYKKDSGKPRVEYNDAVEEALCFGWIDSTVKKIDEQSFAQRFTPRKPISQWSEMNKERMRRLVADEKMTEAGLSKFPHEYLEEELKIPGDIFKLIKVDKEVWQNFTKFPDPYKRIRIGFIKGARNRPQEFQKRLNYFLKMTKQNKKFGMIQ